MEVTHSLDILKVRKKVLTGKTDLEDTSVKMLIEGRGS